MLNRIAIFSDLHANALALQSALEKICRVGFDKIIFLGDLLTYGPDVNKTLDLIHNCMSKYDTTIILGNHDQLYIDLFINKLDYYRTLPIWIKESVDITFQLLDGNLWHAVPFVDQSINHGFFFKHANPFPTPNWSYLNDIELCKSASAKIIDHGCVAGFFGHTHRAGFYDPIANVNYVTETGILEVSQSPGFFFNPGSLGQPRSISSKISTIALLEFDDNMIGEYVVKVEKISYDINPLIKGIDRLALTEDSKSQLISYYR